MPICRQLGPLGATPPHIISPGDVINCLLLWMHHEEVVDAPYLQAAVSQFFVSATIARVTVPVSFDQILFDIVLEQVRHQHTVPGRSVLVFEPMYR